MAFTNNRLEFRNKTSYDEELHSIALANGIPSFVTKGLNINGNTIFNGTFTNNGTFGQLGSEGETQEITPNFTGFLVIKSTLNGLFSSSELIESPTRIDSNIPDTTNIKYFTIYELENGEIKKDSFGYEIGDFRHNNFIKKAEIELSSSGFQFNINGVTSNFVNVDLSGITPRVLSLDEIGYDDSSAGTDFQDIFYYIANLLPTGQNIWLSNNFGSETHYTNLTNAITEELGIIRGKFNYFFTASAGIPNSLDIYDNNTTTKYEFITDNYDTVGNPGYFARRSGDTASWVFFNSASFLHIGLSVNLIPHPYWDTASFNHHVYDFSKYNDSTNTPVNAKWKRFGINTANFNAGDNPTYSEQSTSVPTSPMVSKLWNLNVAGVINGRTPESTASRSSVLRHFIGYGVKSIPGPNSRRNNTNNLTEKQVKLLEKKAPKDLQNKYNKLLKNITDEEKDKITKELSMWLNK